MAKFNQVLVSQAHLLRQRPFTVCCARFVSAHTTKPWTGVCEATSTTGASAPPRLFRPLVRETVLHGRPIGLPDSLNHRALVSDGSPAHHLESLQDWLGAELRDTEISCAAVGGLRDCVVKAGHFTRAKTACW